MVRVQVLLDELLEECLNGYVTDLHFKSFHRPDLYIRQYGCMKQFKRMSLQLYRQLFTYIEYLSNINLNMKAKPQTGHFKRIFKNHTYYFRVSYLPCVDDYAMVVRLLNHEHRICFNDLTDNLSILNDFRQLFRLSYGLVVLCGATGSGKSTTMHAFLDEMYALQPRNIICIEDPIEIYNDHYVQIQISDELNYDEVLKQVLRHDPDIVVIGEIRDSITAAIAVRLALTGHLVFTTLHASNCRIAISRLLNLGVWGNDLRELLAGCIHQTLTYHDFHAVVTFEYHLTTDLLKLYDKIII